MVFLVLSFVQYGFMSGWFLFLLAWCIITATSFFWGAYCTMVKQSYFIFLLKKRDYFLLSTFLNTWSSFALPKRKCPVLISLQACLFFFWPLKVVRGFVVDFFIFWPLYSTTIYQTNTNWCGIAINITIVSIMLSLHLDKCGEGILKGIVCLVLVSHLCNWLKV